MPEVIIVGAGLAGISAATRLIEQGFDVTLYEQNNFLGGKLGAHRDHGKPEPHEHCYHMYLNWYNNFWQFMTEIRAVDKFIPSPVIGCRFRGDKQTRPYLTNPGSPATILTNMLNGIASPADQFLSAYSLLDLIGTQSISGAVLEQTSVSNFFRSRSYSTEGSVAASARTLAEAFASPSYLSSARSYQSLIKYGYRNPTPSLWLLTQNTNDAIFEPWRQHLEARAKALGRRFEIQFRTRVENLHLKDGQVRELTLGRMPKEPTTDRNDEPKPSKTWKTDVPGDLVLAVPPGPLDRLVSPEVAACAPKLETVRLLRSEPMISLDAYFKRKIPGLTSSITLLLGSNYTLSLLDISQVWKDWPAGGGTALNVISSNADLIADYPKEIILDVILKELRHFLDFKLDLRRSIKAPATMMWTTPAATFKPTSARSFSSTRSAAGAIAQRRRVKFPISSWPAISARPSLMSLRSKEPWSAASWRPRRYAAGAGLVLRSRSSGRIPIRRLFPRRWRRPYAPQPWPQRQSQWSIP